MTNVSETKQGGDHMQINPLALDRAKEITGARSDEQLGQLFLDRSGASVRNWRAGRTAPDLETVAKLQRLTAWSYDEILTNNPPTAA